MNRTKNDTPVCLVDSNEWQRTRTRWDLAPDFAMKRQKLPCGDYTLAGYERRVIIERKAADDLVQSLITDRERFLEVVRQMAEYEYRFVLAEAALPDIAAGQYASGAHPESVLGAIASLEVDFGVRVVFCGSRHAAIWYAKRLFLRLLERFAQDEERES